LINCFLAKVEQSNFSFRDQIRRRTSSAAQTGQRIQVLLSKLEAGDEPQSVSLQGLHPQGVPERRRHDPRRRSPDGRQQNRKTAAIRNPRCSQSRRFISSLSPTK
jgi:hypothetical protein